MQRTEKGWKLQFDDGNSTEFSAYKDATEARWNSYEAKVLNLNGTVREAIENSERNLTNNQARRFEFDASNMSVSRMKRENPELAATLDERMDISTFMDDGRAEQQQYADAAAGNAALSQDRETMEASMLVLGTSSVSFREGVRVGVSKLYRGFNATTVVEETLEADASQLLKNGKREWMIKALRETEQQTGEVPGSQYKLVCGIPR